MNSLDNYFQFVLNDCGAQIIENVEIADLGRMCLVCPAWYETLSKDRLFPIMQEIGQEMQAYVQSDKSEDRYALTCSILGEQFALLLSTSKIDGQTEATSESYTVNIKRFFQLWLRMNWSPMQTAVTKETVSRLIQNEHFVPLSALFEEGTKAKKVLPRWSLECIKFFDFSVDYYNMCAIFAKIIAQPSSQGDDTQINTFFLEHPDKIPQKFPPFLAASLLLQLNSWACGTISDEKSVQDNWEMAEKIFPLSEVLEKIECPISPILIDKPKTLKNWCLLVLSNEFYKVALIGEENLGNLKCALNCCTRMNPSLKEFGLACACLRDAIKQDPTFDVEPYIDQILQVSDNPDTLYHYIRGIYNAYQNEEQPLQAQALKEHYERYQRDKLYQTFIKVRFLGNAYLPESSEQRSLLDQEVRQAVQRARVELI